MHRLVIASVTLIGLVGAAVVAGYLLLFAGGGDRAATLAPAQSAVYVNVYLQPSTGQQMNLGGLIGRLPGFADDAALDDKVDQVVQNLLSSAGIDYREQVKPWLGDQVALAAWPTGTDATQSEAVVIAEVRDPEAARAAVAELAAGDGTLSAETYEGVELQVGEGTAYAFVDEMLVIGGSSAGLHAVIDARGGAESLGEQADFREAMSRIPDDHLASVFVDLAALAVASGTEDQLDGWTTASAALVAERDGLRLSGSAPIDPAAAAASSPDAGTADRVATLTEWMPAGTLAEVVVFGVSQVLEDAEAAASATPQGEELGSALDGLRAIAAFGLGIDIDADVLPLLDGEVAVALGSIGADGTPSGQLLLRPTDSVDVEATLTNLADRLAAAGAGVSTEPGDGVEITTLTLEGVGEAAFAVSDDVVVIGLSADDVRAALDANASGSALAAADDYARTFEVAGAHAGTEAYLDVSALADALGDTLALPTDVRDILSGIGSFGLTLPSRDDQIEFHAVLTVDEP